MTQIDFWARQAWREPTIKIPKIPTWRGSLGHGLFNTGPLSTSVQRYNKRRLRRHLKSLLSLDKTRTSWGCYGLMVVLELLSVAFKELPVNQNWRIGMYYILCKELLMELKGTYSTLKVYVFW